MKSFTFRRFYQYMAALSGSTAVLSSGINLGWTSPYLPDILNGTNLEIQMTNEEGSWCAVMPLVGAPLGAFLVAMIVDKIGRKKTTLCMAPIASLMFISLAFVRTTFLICLVRFIVGSVEGGLYTVLPMYYGEISDPSIRGMLVSSIPIAGISGSLFINVIGFKTSIFVSSLICSLIPLVHLVSFSFMPESPYYYIKKGDLGEAQKSLQVLRGTRDVDDEMQTLKEAISRQEQHPKSKLSDLFTIKSNRRACIIFLILNATKKYSGKNPLLFYTTSIFGSAQGSLDPQLSVIIFILIELLVTTFAIFIIDRIGRRPMIISSTVVCSASLACVALYFYFKTENPSSVQEFGWIPLTTLVTYNVWFNVGLELVSTIFLGELFPTNVKAMALGLADTISIANGTICSKLFQFFTDNYGLYVSFGLCSICCFIGLIFIVKIVPETKNKTLEEIQFDLISKTTKNVT